MSERVSFGIQYLHGSFSGPDAPATCRACGRPMRVYQTQGYWLSVDPKWNSDGTPNWVRHAQCSARWWQRLVGLHDHAVQDKFGDWPWV